MGRSWLNKIITNKPFQFFFLLGIAVFVLFKNSYSTTFFLDDWFFLKIGHASSIKDFLMFFWPYKTYFYRPIPTELFYLFINSIGSNLIFVHTLGLVLYFVGLIYLWRTANLLVKHKEISYLLTFLYAINFTRVFQIYQIATFIELVLFVFLTITLYYFLSKNYFLAFLFYILALLSKESALLLPLFLLMLPIMKIRSFSKRDWQMFGVTIIISIFFFILVRPSTSYVTSTEPLYHLQFNPKLIINNFMWYTLWSLGLPNYFPNYMTSIFAFPLPEFWNLMATESQKYYIYSLILYYALFIPSTIIIIIKLIRTKQYSSIKWLLFLMAGYVLFIGLTLPTIHRWMVRLTIPLLFILAFQAYIIFMLLSSSKTYKLVGLALLLLYTSVQIYAVPIHESSSMYLLESKISKNLSDYIEKNKSVMKNYSGIFFVDKEGKISGWGGSKKLRDTLHDNDFIYHFFNDKQYVGYDFRDQYIPKNSYVIDANVILDRKF